MTTPLDNAVEQDGKFYREVSYTDKNGDQRTIMAPVCEDCGTTIPRYVDFPRGLVSPESSGDPGGNFAKTRKIWMETNEPKQGVEMLQKVVCLPCYFEAFRRFYPGAPLPELRGDYDVYVQEASIPVNVGVAAADPTI